MLPLSCTGEILFAPDDLPYRFISDAECQPPAESLEMNPVASPFSLPCVSHRDCPLLYQLLSDPINPHREGVQEEIATELDPGVLGGPV